MSTTTLVDIISNSSDKSPHKAAFRFEQEAISYRELEVKTTQLAKYLASVGVQKGDRVGIFMNRCLESVIAVYGIMKAGAAYVPLDANAPHARTVFLLNDANIKIVVGTETFSKKLQKLLEAQSPLERLIGVQLKVTYQTTPWKEIYQVEIKDFKPILITEEDVAYIMYTSGSTGLPKGIVHSHKSGLTYARLSAQLFKVSPEDRVGNHAPLHFDISTFGYFTAPLAGATTIIIPEAHTKLPVSMLALMEKEKLSIWYSVPLALIQLHLCGLISEYNLTSLRCVLFGGENFTLKYLRALMQEWPHAKFYNIYGPAEVNQCTHYLIDELPPLDKPVPIGKVWGANEYKILNKNDQELRGIGQVGELVVKTDTMMIGYWNNPELTKKSFYLENTSSNKTKKYFRTGDLVKRNLTNDLVFVGRNDRQVKFRGYRVELDEIETVLERHNLIKKAAVCLVNSSPSDTVIFAGIQLEKTTMISPNALKLYCKLHLPPYMVPQKIEIMKEFPKTSSGKIDLLAFKNKIKAI
ncbi:amino acid adenylation domain-containing protein [Arenibacter lacus]|uniref:amino acid adenylation domain-containing protein n=1 Tax=Arenibacter lacus TaxID=2608629 RepID=UPI00123DF8D6|nr:amino acid adenylation domain-containing protein [Arenibacter lacus]